MLINHHADIKQITVDHANGKLITASLALVRCDIKASVGPQPKRFRFSRIRVRGIYSFDIEVEVERAFEHYFDLSSGRGYRCEHKA